MKRIVVGVSGASGTPYAVRLLEFFRAHQADLDLDVHLVFSKMGRVIWNDEVGFDPAEYAFPVYKPGDMTAPFASGSARFDAMVIVPCSAGTVGRIATGVSTNLIGRAADVMLKERKKLLLVVREMPYSLVLLRSMATVTEAGGVIMPASPSFYSAPQNRNELLDTVTARVLDHLGFDNDLVTRWSGSMSRGGAIARNAPGAS